MRVVHLQTRKIKSVHDACDSKKQQLLDGEIKIQWMNFLILSLEKFANLHKCHPSLVIIVNLQVFKIDLLCNVIKL